MAPTPPNARQRPGKAVALLDSGRRPRNGPHTPQRSAAPRQSRGAPRLRAEAPKWPPHPPTLGSAPAKPWRSSTQGGGPEMAPTPPNARQRPGKAVALLDSGRGPPPEQAEAAHGHHDLAVLVQDFGERAHHAAVRLASRGYDLGDRE